MKIDRQSFFLKVMAVLTVVLVLLGVAITLQTRSMMDTLFTEQQEKRGISIANMLSARAANLILVHNYYDLHELVKETQQSNDDVRYAFVVSNEGEVLAHSFPGGFPGDLLRANIPEPFAQYHIAALTTEEGIVRDIVVPIFDGRVGFVHVGMSDVSLRTILGKTTRQLLLETLVAVFIGIILMVLLTSRLMRPVRDLVRATNAIAAGDFTQRATVRSNDELGRLAGAFNVMADYLHRLMTELRQKEEARTQLLQKVIVAQEDERKRIARELHDETGQTLTSLMMGLKSLAESCPATAQECRIDEMRAVVKTTLGEIHRLAVELRPSILDDMGLIPALEKYVSDYRDAHGIDVDLHVTWGVNHRVAHEVEVTVYRIVQEALTNISKYAKAENVSVIITCDDKGLEAIVEDDGIGFVVEELGEDARNKLGLYGMQERASLVGGTFTIESSPGRGTTIYARIPLNGEVG
ncbi:MAG: HAMP domain-containing protein [Negativicutes bacterium]|nr:HAMP domain-containing protein [Negativicutes bacterium]